MLKIILDCDDVLYQTNEAALERLNEELGTSYGLEDITKWGTISRELDCRLEYFQDPEFIWGLPVYDEASEFIASLMEFGDVVLATSVSPCCATARMNAIRRDFPMVNPENALICNDKCHISGDFMLDDGYHNVVRSAAKVPVLYEKPWNRDPRYLATVSSYRDFINFISRYRRQQYEQQQ